MATLSCQALAYITIIFLLKYCNGIFIEKEAHESWSCLKGWVAKDMTTLPDKFESHVRYCDMDKGSALECKKHCLAKKLNLIQNGQIWLFKLDMTLKELYPGPEGRESVDKVTDIILEYSDHYFKTKGLMSEQHCGAEKKMWKDIITAIDSLCPPRKKTNGGRSGGYHKAHSDILIDRGEHFHPHPEGGGEKYRPPNSNINKNMMTEV